jgi:predicted RNA-binding Zn-ribbon protein involved in translation (DUF1610 family)
MPNTKCSSCKKPITESAKYCPACGVAVKAKDSFLIEDDALRQKIEQRMRSLEKSLKEFNLRFEDLDVDSMVENDELLEFAQEVSKISKKLQRFGKLEEQEGIDVDGLIKEHPALGKEIKKFHKAVKVMEKDVISILEEQNDSEASTDESFGTPALKFHIFFWSASLLVSAIPSYIAYMYFDEQQWVFAAGMALGLLISYRINRSSFIQCPNCDLYIRRNQSLLETKNIGSRDGWHTESEEVETFHNDGIGQLPSRSSTTYINRSVPHRDYYYQNVFECYSCDKRFSEQFSERVNM